MHGNSSSSPEEARATERPASDRIPGCGTETEKFRAGNCIRCALRAGLAGMLLPVLPRT